MAVPFQKEEDSPPILRRHPLEGQGHVLCWPIVLALWVSIHPTGDLIHLIQRTPVNQAATAKHITGRMRRNPIEIATRLILRRKRGMLNERLPGPYKHLLRHIISQHLITKEAKEIAPYG